MKLIKTDYLYLLHHVDQDDWPAMLHGQWIYNSAQALEYIKEYEEEHEAGKDELAPVPESCIDCFCYEPVNLCCFDKKKTMKIPNLISKPEWCPKITETVNE